MSNDVKSCSCPYPNAIAIPSESASKSCVLRRSNANVPGAGLRHGGIVAPFLTAVPAPCGHPWLRRVLRLPKRFPTSHRPLPRHLSPVPQATRTTWGGLFTDPTRLSKLARPGTAGNCCFNVFGSGFAAVPCKGWIAQTSKVPSAPLRETSIRPYIQKVAVFREDNPNQHADRLQTSSESNARASSPTPQP